MTTHSETRRTQQFPKRFLWGAATAAHQVEGDTHNQWTVWELEHAKTNAAKAEYHIGDFSSWEDVKHDAKDPHNYVSGTLADHYHRYEEDFEFLEKMNMNAFRFSVEWSRIEPVEGAFNVEAIEHYKSYIKSLKKRDIEPVMTLLHFTLPTWFADRGGFRYRSNVKYFVRYVEKIVSELGNDVRFIIVMNEPEIYAYESYRIGEWPPNETSMFAFWRVLNNHVLAFRRASRVIHGLNRRYKVGLSKHSLFFYPGDTAWVSKVTAAIGQYLQDDYFLKKVVRRSDFIGINYYQSARTLGYRVHNPEDAPKSDLDWVLAPGDIEFVLERLHRKYKLPILITENGLADHKDAHRKWWIQETLQAIARAMKRDVVVLGYLHWSLMDNFEWAFGRWPRFGLVRVDYKTGKRTLRPSAVWFGGIIKKLRGV